MLSVSSATSAPIFQSTHAAHVYSQQLRSERSTRIAIPVSVEPDQQQGEENQPPSGDRVSLSPEARQQSEQENINNRSSSGSQTTSQELTDEERRSLEQLKQRDTEVRAHEQAHLASAGQYAAGGPSFTYQQGPDGKRYAIGGEVPIDIGKEATAEETIKKMQVVRRAALAPASPSGADRNIAAAASQKEAQARLELQSEQTDIQDTNAPEDGAQESSIPPAPSSDQSTGRDSSQQINTLA